VRSWALLSSTGTGADVGDELKRDAEGVGAQGAQQGSVTPPGKEGSLQVSFAPLIGRWGPGKFQRREWAGWGVQGRLSHCH
jgi:hypothetical protein